MSYDFLGFACASCVLRSYLFEAAGRSTGSVEPGGVGYNDYKARWLSRAAAVPLHRLDLLDMNTENIKQ